MRPIILILSIMAITTCTSTADVQAIQDREWRLAWVEGFPSTPAGVATPTIRFGSDGRLGGNTGCNSAGADYTAEGDRLTIGMTMATKRACAEPAGNELERAYLDAVGRTRRFRISNAALELLDESGAVVARFVQ